MEIDSYIFTRDYDKEKYIIAVFNLECITNVNLYDISKAIALGQSIGNPEIRSIHETKELFERACVKVLDKPDELKKKKSGCLKFAFPTENLNMKEDGINQLLCHLMGGHLDIDSIRRCNLLDIEFPHAFLSFFKGPKFGISGIREYAKAFDKPVLGTIIKPKVGLNKQKLLDIVKDLVEGGADFIKEDEIMSNPAVCPLEERASYIMKYINNCGRKVVYAVCINSDYPYFIERAKKIYELGGNCVHLNIWAGLSAYKALRDLELPIMLFFQKSGDKILTNERHHFYISWNLICKIARIIGVDFIQAGMWGGYSHSEEFALREIINTLTNAENNFRPVLPSLSCGMHPGLVGAIVNKFGTDVMLTVGGAIHGHPDGSRAGTMAMRQAIQLRMENKFSKQNMIRQKELKKAIEKWGYIE